MTIKISKLKALLNFLNACLGFGILAMPYIIGVTGWYSFISVIIAFSMATYSAICMARIAIKTIDMEPIQSTNAVNKMTDCNTEAEMTSITNEVEDEDNNLRDIPDTTQASQPDQRPVFQKLCKAALGTYGEIYGCISYVGTLIILDIILLIQSYELLTQLLLTFIGNNDAIAYTATNDYLIFLYVFILMLPTCFALNWRQMTWISVMSNISVLFVVGMIVYVFAYFLMQFGKIGQPIPAHYFEHYESSDTNIVKHATENINIALLIFYSLFVFANSIGANGAIPSLANSLENPRDIYWVVIIAYSIVTFIYALCGCLGFVVYDKYTHAMIINNFFDWPNGWLIIIFSLTILVNLWGSHGIYSSLLSEFIDGILNIQQKSKSTRIALRMFDLLLKCMVACFGRNYLAFWFAVNGVWTAALGIVLTLTWMLYIGMFWNSMSKVSIVLHIILLLLCIVMGVLAAYGSITGLL